MSTLRSTSRSIDSGDTPGRSNSIWKTSPCAPGVHRHHGRAVRGTQDLAGQPVEVAERVRGAQQHGGCLPSGMCNVRYRFYIPDDSSGVNRGGDRCRGCRPTGVCSPSRWRPNAPTSRSRTSGSTSAAGCSSRPAPRAGPGSTARPTSSSCSGSATLLDEGLNLAGIRRVLSSRPRSPACARARPTGQVNPGREGRIAVPATGYR